jgi:hypothetical protein
LPNSDEWCREVDEALFGDVDALPQPDQPASVEFPPATEAEAEPRAVAVDEVDAALFGTTTAEPVAPLPLVDELDDETIIAEPADVDDAPETSGPGRGRRAWVVAGFTALAVVIAASAGAVIAGRSEDPGPGKKTVSDRTSPSTTTTTTPPTTAPPPPPPSAPAASAPPPAPTAPRTPTTSRRTVPAPTDPVPPEPTTPSPEPPTTSPQPSPTTSPTPPSSSSILGP